MDAINWLLINGAETLLRLGGFVKSLLVGLWILLDAALEPSKTLTLVSAPAGAGKSTALATWLARNDEPHSAWLQVDARDNDPIRFWSGVVTALAEVLLGWGWRLSGSDLAPEAVRALAASGAQIFRGHAPDHLPPGAELVIHSDAVPEENPELRRARELGVPALSYFEMLGRLMRGRRGLAVAGTHGKSTTTAMLAELLVERFEPGGLHFSGRLLGSGDVGDDDLAAFFCQGFGDSPADPAGCAGDDGDLFVQ